MAPSASVILAALPIAVFGTGLLVTPPAPAPALTPVPVQTEGVTARRIDDTTFRRRWPSDLPPLSVIREVPVPTVAAAAATAKPRPARIVKRASLRLDICAKHGMRKVTYLKRGYQHWRCRR